MITKDFIGLTTLCCPNCKGDDFMFSGIQKGYGYVPDMELWTCKECFGTFSKWSSLVSKEEEEVKYREVAKV